MLSENRNFFYLIQDIAGEESSECATRKRKAQSVSAITCWRKLSNISRIHVRVKLSQPACVLLCRDDNLKSEPWCKPDSNKSPYLYFIMMSPSGDDQKVGGTRQGEGWKGCNIMSLQKHDFEGMFVALCRRWIIHSPTSLGVISGFRWWYLLAYPDHVRLPLQLY